MEPEQYNPKAREAFGRSLIEIGVAISKGLILLFTVVPMAAIIKSIFDGSKSISLVSVTSSLSVDTQAVILFFIIVSFIAGHFFRKEGLRHLHELEQNEDKT